MLRGVNEESVGLWVCEESVKSRRKFYTRRHSDQSLNGIYDTETGNFVYENAFHFGRKSRYTL